MAEKPTTSGTTQRPKTRQRTQHQQEAVIERVPVCLGPHKMQRQKSLVIGSTTTLSSQKEQVAQDAGLKVKELISKLQPGTKFEDKEFPIGPWALWFDSHSPPNDSELSHPATWKRVTELVDENASLFGATKVTTTAAFQINDIAQGALGDGFLISAISTIISRHSEIIKSLFVSFDTSKGIYSVLFYYNLGWRFVVVDDFIPCSTGGLPLYSFSKSKSSFWIAILEKAYAKLHGCYENINGGIEKYALGELIGLPNVILRLRDETVQQDAKSGKLWQFLLSRSRENALITCQVERNESSENGLIAEGLIAGHWYLLLKMIEIENIRLIQLFSTVPNSRSSWAGRWSEGDRMWRQNPELRQKLGSSLFEENTFVMEFNDFCCFSNISIHRLNHSSWNAANLTGMWDLGKTPQGDTCGMSGWFSSPQYGIKVSGHSTSVCVTLCQLSTKPFSGEDYYPVSIDLRICLTTRAGHWQITENTQCIGISQSASVNERQVTIEATLEPQEDPYTIVVGMGVPGIVMPFALSVSANHEFELIDPITNGIFIAQIEKAYNQANCAQSESSSPFADIFEEWLYSMTAQTEIKKPADFKWRACRISKAQNKFISFRRRLCGTDFNESLHITNPFPLTLKLAEQSQQQQQQQPITLPFLLGLKELNETRPSTGESLVTAFKQIWGSGKQSSGKFLGQISSSMKPASTTHQCIDRSCIEWGKGWKKVFVIVRDWETAGEHPEQSLVPIANNITTSEQPSLRNSPSLVPEPTIESLWKLIVSAQVVTDPSHARILEVQDRINTWVSVKTISDILACASYPDLKLRITLETPAKPKAPTLVLMENTGNGAETRITVSWELSNSEIPITGHTLILSEETSEGEITGEKKTFDIPQARTTAILEGVLSKRLYQIAVSAKNIVGSGPPSDALTLTPAKMLDSVLVKKISFQKNPVLCIAADKEYTQIVTGSRDRKVCVWKTDTSELLQAFTLHSGAVYCVAIHTESKTAFSGSEDGTVRIWNLEKLAESGTLPLPFDRCPVRSMLVSGDLLLIGAGQSVSLWDISKRSWVKKVQFSSIVRSIRYSGDLIYVGLEDGTIEIHKNAPKGIPGTAMAVHPSSVISITGDSENTITCCEAGHARLWQKPMLKKPTKKSAQQAVKTPEILEEISVWERKVHNGPIYGTVLLGKRIITASFDGSLGITSLRTGERLFSFPLSFGSIHCITQAGTDSVFIGSQCGVIAKISVPEDLVSDKTQSNVKVSAK